MGNTVTVILAVFQCCNIIIEPKVVCVKLCEGFFVLITAVQDVTLNFAKILLESECSLNNSANGGQEIFTTFVCGYILSTVFTWRDWLDYSLVAFLKRFVCKWWTRNFWRRQPDTIQKVCVYTLPLTVAINISHRIYWQYYGDTYIKMNMFLPGRGSMCGDLVKSVFASRAIVILLI